MYRIYCDHNEVLYDVRIDRFVGSPILNLEANTAGSLSFKIYPDHPYYNAIKKLKTTISVQKEEKTIFKGRVYADESDFYNCKPIECEGKLVYLKDSILQPFEFSGSPEEFFTMIVTNHNAQVSDKQKFKIGNITVTDNNDYIVRSSEKRMNSWDAVKNKCFNSSTGGYINIRYESDGDYLDWLTDFEEVSAQAIQYGENLLDINIKKDAGKTYTAIMPIGAEVDGTKIDISSVNDGKNYLINEQAAAEYGIIYAPEDVSTWGDVTLPSNLLSNAKAYLDGTLIKMSESITLNAIDLNLTDDEIESFDFCSYIKVISSIHGVYEQYLLAKMSIDIANPQNTKLELGTTRLTLTDMLSNTSSIAGRVSNIENTYMTQSAVKIVTSEEVVSKVEELNLPTETRVTEIVNEVVENVGAGKSAYEIAVANGFTGTEADWILSLKGDTGDIGPVGATGSAGIQGEQGIQGIQGIQGEKGDKGDKGDIGETGPAGADGTMTFDELTPEQKLSLKGDTGAQGIQGIQGIQGEKGDKGDTGNFTSLTGTEGYVIQYVDGVWIAANPIGNINTILDTINGEVI